METNQSITNHNPMGTELQTLKDKPKSSLFVAVVISVLLSAVVTGSAVYFWQRSANEKVISSLKQKVFLLEDQILTTEEMEESKEISLPETFPTPTTDSTVNLKTYVNKKFGFSIQYPEHVVVDEKYRDGYLTVFFRLKDLDSGTPLVCNGTNLAINVNYDGLCGSLVYKGSISESEVIQSNYLVDEISTIRYDDYFQGKHVETRLAKVSTDANYYLIDYIIVPEDYPRLDEIHRLFNRMLSTIKFTD